MLAITSRLGVVAMALLIVGVFAACGSSSGEGSDQFREQTDSPLLDFGEEGDAAALGEAEEAVKAFFESRAKGDWDTACAQLAREMLDKIQHLATSATGLEDTSCPSFLGAFTVISAKERKDSTVIGPGSLRERGERAFLIYKGANDVVYAMPLSREGSEWKLASLSSKSL